MYGVGDFFLFVRLREERDTAMQNVGELESMLTECQKKAKDRIRKVSKYVMY